MSDSISQSGTAFTAYLSFRAHLVSAAAEHLRRIDPAYVATVRREIARAEDVTRFTVVPLPESAAERFSRLRRLLNATFEVELYYRQVNAAVILLAVPGAHQLPPEVAHLQIDPSEQFFHHLQAWSMSLGSLFDRVENLATLTVRQLMRPTNRGSWQSAEKRLKDALKAGQDKHRALRNSFSHQGGLFDELASSGVWEQAAAVEQWLDTSVACRFMHTNHADYVERTARATVTALRDVDEILGELDREIDWAAVKAIQL